MRRLFFIIFMIIIFFFHLVKSIIFIEKQKLKNDIENKKKTSSISPRAVGGNYKNSGDCFYSEVLNSYGELLTGNIITAVFEDVKAKNLKGVAKKLAKIGIKGNLAGIAATMVSKDVQCNLKYGLL
ncbi:Uncharacterised protein [Staphylococcus aureus]|nr:Uncharacterised protein [Staphylococcus aureus]